MNNVFELLLQPWPWYVAGPLIGLTVPLLLLIGNRSLGVSSSMRHLCAMALPAGISYFEYDWKKETWNLFFVAGIFIGGTCTALFLQHPDPIQLHPDLVRELAGYGITNVSGFMPPELFSWGQLMSLRGFILMIGGGFIMGFGTRYAGGCTSGHSILGISTLQMPSLIATCCFMLGGYVMTNFIMPFILKL